MYSIRAFCRNKKHKNLNILWCIAFVICSILFKERHESTYICLLLTWRIVIIGAVSRPIFKGNRYEKYAFRQTYVGHMKQLVKWWHKNQTPWFIQVMQIRIGRMCISFILWRRLFCSNLYFVLSLFWWVLFFQRNVLTSFQTWIKA